MTCRQPPPSRSGTTAVGQRSRKACEDRSLTRRRDCRHGPDERDDDWDVRRAPVRGDRPANGQAGAAGPRACGADERRPAVDRQPRRRTATQVHKGDVAEIADGITLVPTPGWELATRSARRPHALAGRQHGHDAARRRERGRSYVQAAPFDGTPSALLSRVNKINADLEHARGRAAATTDRYAVTTRQGVVGVAEDFVGVDRQGSIVAFVFKSPAARRRGSRPRGRGDRRLRARRARCRAAATTSSR